MIECDFYHSFYGYTCNVQNQDLNLSHDDREVTGVKGYRLSGKSSDVKVFFSDSKKFTFFPRGLAKFYKNIETVQIYKGGLKEIIKDDLQQFGENLKFLALNFNEIEVLEADLFSANKNLKEISFESNKIMHIEHDTFNGLENLQKLWMSFNLCTGENDYIEDAVKVLELIKNVEEKCENLKAILVKTKARNKILEKENEKLKSKIWIWKFHFLFYRFVYDICG